MEIAHDDSKVGGHVLAKDTNGILHDITRPSFEDDEDTERYWTNLAKVFLQGKTIKTARYMTKKEAEEFGWYHRPIIVYFTDGTDFIVQSDDEGNNGGVLNVSDEDISILPVMR